MTVLSMGVGQLVAFDERLMRPSRSLGVLVCLGAL